MGRPIDINALQSQLEELQRKLAKYEGEREKNYKRRQRTKELIQLGAVVKKFRPDYTPQKLSDLLTFIRETREEQQKLIARWNARTEDQRHGNLPSERQDG